MSDTSEQVIKNLLSGQRNYFSSGETKNIDFRIKQLKILKSTIIKFEEKISSALYEDLHKSKEEAYLTEISIVLQEINNHIRHLRSWAKPEKVRTPWHLLPSAGKIIYEPLGLALIIAPWNYPFQLLFNPLIGAVSAGCCAVLKPSPYTPKTI